MMPSITEDHITLLQDGVLDALELIAMVYFSIKVFSHASWTEIIFFSRILAHVLF